MASSTPDDGADEAARRTAVDFARDLVPLAQAVLGAAPLGTYLIGSLAHGGFSRRYSDVDVAVIVESALTPDELDRLKNAATACSAAWGPKLSVFWTDRGFRIGRFPPLDIVDFLDHAVALHERERVRPQRPTIDEIRRQLRGALDAWIERARRFATAQTLAQDERKPYLRALLYPARFSYSWMTGRMASNDDAVGFVSEMRPAHVNVDSIVRALRCRQLAADSDALFAERAVLTTQIDACVRLSLEA